MSKLIGLLAFAMIFPAFWGLFAYWLALRLWPSARRQTAPWTISEPNPGAEFLDYQI